VKFFPRYVIVESLVIIAAAAILGFVSNLYHPNAIPFTWKRPSIHHSVGMADTVLAYELPQTNITTDQTMYQSSTGLISVSFDQVLKLMITGQAILVDARAKEDYEKFRIEGAINLPFGEYEVFFEGMKTLPRDKWIICYCDGPQCDLSKALAQELTQNGFKKIAVYDDGLAGWQKLQSSIHNKELRTDAR